MSHDRLKWYALAGAIISEVAATLSLKAALDHTGWYLLVALGYAASFALLAIALRHGMKVAVAYGIWSAGGVTLTTVLSALLFAEPLTGLMGLGIAVIIAGVLTVELGGTAQPTTDASTPDAGLTR